MWRYPFSIRPLPFVCNCITSVLFQISLAWRCSFQLSSWSIIGNSRIISRFLWNPRISSIKKRHGFGLTSLTTGSLPSSICTLQRVLPSSITTSTMTFSKAVFALYLAAIALATPLEKRLLFKEPTSTQVCFAWIHDCAHAYDERFYSILVKQPDPRFTGH